MHIINSIEKVTEAKKYPELFDLKTNWRISATIRNTPNSSCETKPKNVIMINTINNSSLLFHFSLISPSSTNPLGNPNSIRGVVKVPLFRKELGSLMHPRWRPMT